MTDESDGAARQVTPAARWRRVAAEDATWCYMARARTAHALPPNNRFVAVCGLAPEWPGTWFGTGSQGEYEKAAALPKCKVCARRLGLLR